MTSLPSMENKQQQEKFDSILPLISAFSQNSSAHITISAYLYFNYRIILIKVHII
jgi:hypothetical protein